mgnify:CR=1 FL=1
MKVKTSKGKEFEASFAYAPTFDGKCVIGIKDDRPLSLVCSDFEELAYIEKQSNLEGDAKYENYSELVRVDRSKEQVIIILERRDDR